VDRGESVHVALPLLRLLALALAGAALVTSDAGAAPNDPFPSGPQADPDPGSLRDDPADLAETEELRAEAAAAREDGTAPPWSVDATFEEAMRSDDALVLLDEEGPDDDDEDEDEEPIGCFVE
jgi:hypothetical protein